MKRIVGDFKDPKDILDASFKKKVNKGHERKAAVQGSFKLREPSATLDDVAAKICSLDHAAFHLKSTLNVFQQLNACQLIGFLTYSVSDYKVPLAALSESQLALCHPEKDLLPLVLANCHYTLKKGQQTVSSYDYPAIERELSRRFFASKPRIQTVSPHILNLIIILVFNI